MHVCIVVCVFCVCVLCVCVVCVCVCVLCVCVLCVCVVCVCVCVCVYSEYEVLLATVENACMYNVQYMY